MTNPPPVQELKPETFETLHRLAERFPALHGYFSSGTGGADMDHIIAVLDGALTGQHSRAEEAVAWPRATGSAAEGGWALDVQFLERIGKLAMEKCGYDATTEFVEAVLLSASPASPSATGVRVKAAIGEALERLWDAQPPGEAPSYPAMLEAINEVFSALGEP